MMDQTHRETADRYDIAVHIIGLPFRAMQSAAKMTAQAVISRRQEIKPGVQQTPVPEQKSEVAVRPILRAADRVHSQMYGQQKVCFYHYGKEQVIKATARRDGKAKDVFFTPEVAVQHSLPFSMEGATLWVGEFGFKQGIATSIALPYVRTETVINEVPTKAIVEAPAQAPAASESLPTRSESIKSKRPFEGTVVSFGPTQRNGLNGKPPYMTYCLKLISNLTGEREFIGEQLAELVDQYGLKKDQLVRLHPLGRRPFQVVENGKPQDRHRNEYSIEIL
ncbi:hypothetical protein LPN04_29915 [Rugamonas sp. A1-17]|nr:hypothetical protein [Rugamonas sp. A1-17]